MEQEPLTQDRLCPRCGKFYSPRYFGNRGTMCRRCISKGQQHRSRYCPHDLILRDKPGLTCAQCSAHWSGTRILFGSRTFIAFKKDPE